SPGTEEGAPLRQKDQQRKYFRGRDFARRCATPIRRRTAVGLRRQGETCDGAPRGIRGADARRYQGSRKTARGQNAMMHRELASVANHLWQSTLCAAGVWLL